MGEWSVSTWLTKHGYKDRLREFQIERGMPTDSLADYPQQFTHAGQKLHHLVAPGSLLQALLHQLIKFTHARYKGTEIPKDFSSHIHLHNSQTREDRDVLIYMNNPLRYAGKRIIKAGFRKDAGTILQVVRNPAWLTPYFACIVVGLGL